MRKTLDDIIKGSIDLHFHVGPEIIPRKYTVRSLVDAEKGRMKGCVLKNHFYPTSPLFTEEDRKDLLLFGGVVLNNAVGGLNPDAVYAAAMVAPEPLFVWLPTIHTAQFLETSTYEIPPEWTGGKGKPSRLARDVKPVIIAENGKLVDDVSSVIKAVKDVKGILCTGHIGWKESVLVVNEATRQGLKNLVITHPIYQRIGMPVSVQKELVSCGCLIEHCASMHTIDKIPIPEIANQILEVGVENIVFSSDVGQSFSSAPSQALTHFMTELMRYGVSLRDVERICCVNPHNLLGIPLNDAAP